jgi:hypothetical protein
LEWVADRRASEAIAGGGWSTIPAQELVDLAFVGDLTVAKLTGLTYLQTFGNNFTDRGVQQLATLVNLDLYLEEQTLTLAAFDFVERLPHLTRLGLQDVRSANAMSSNSVADYPAQTSADGVSYGRYGGATPQPHLGTGACSTTSAPGWELCMARRVPHSRYPTSAARNSGSLGNRASSAAMLISDAKRKRCSGVMSRSLWWASIVW